MKLKQIIFLIVTIAALAGVGVLGYLMFTDSQNPTSLTQEPTLEILPQGSELDFDDVNKFNKTGKKFRYPIVTPTEVKVELNDLMEPTLAQ